MLSQGFGAPFSMHGLKGLILFIFTLLWEFVQVKVLQVCISKAKFGGEASQKDYIRTFSRLAYAVGSHRSCNPNMAGAL